MILNAKRRFAGVLAGLLLVIGLTPILAMAQNTQKRFHEPVYRANQEQRVQTRGNQPATVLPQAIPQALPQQQAVQPIGVAPQQQAVLGQGNAQQAIHRGNQDIGAPNANRQIPATGQEQGGVAQATFTEPIVVGPNDHPLDPALHIARRGLDKIRTEIGDYTGYIVKRERINGRLTGKETMFFKIRNRHRTEDGTAVPFSIYMRFVDPEPVKGREVIWVEGRNDNKLVAHDVGWKALFRANLDPEGRMAMSGQRYPIYEAGIENLVVKLIEKAERDRAAGDCKVDYYQGAEINGRKCTVIQVTHPEKRDPYDFHLAQVYVDDELQIPIRYAAYSWPRKQGGSPVLEEEYTYLDLKLNVGLDDRDFDPDNPEYDYP